MRKVRISAIFEDLVQKSSRKLRTSSTSTRKLRIWAIFEGLGGGGGGVNTRVYRKNLGQRVRRNLGQNLGQNVRQNVRQNLGQNVRQNLGQNVRQPIGASASFFSESVGFEGGR